MSISSEQFLNGMLNDNDFSSSVTRKIAISPDDLGSYLVNAGLTVDSDDLDSTRRTVAQTDVRLWAGTYIFTKPAMLKDKKLRVESSTRTVTLDDKPVSLTNEGVNAFRWTYEGNIVRITFADVINDDGSVAPSTFGGTISYSSAIPGGATAEEAVEGEQLVFSEVIPWNELEGGDSITLVASTIGVLPVIYSVVSWLKNNRTSFEVSKRYLRAKSSAVELENNHLGDYGKIQLNGMKDDFMQDFKSYFSLLARNIVRGEDISTTSVDDRISAVVASLKPEEQEYLKFKLNALIRESLLIELLEQKGFASIDRVFEIRQNVIEANIAELVESARAAINGANYIRDCVRSGIQGARIDRLNDQAAEIERQLAANAQAQADIRSELGGIIDLISQLQQQLAQCEESQIESIQAQIDSASRYKFDLERSLEDLGEDQRRWEEELTQIGQNIIIAEQNQQESEVDRLKAQQAEITRQLAANAQAQADIKAELGGIIGLISQLQQQLALCEESHINDVRAQLDSASGNKFELERSLDDLGEDQRRWEEDLMLIKQNIKIAEDDQLESEQRVADTANHINFN